MTATTASGPAPSCARNWNAVRTGIVRHTPGSRSTVTGSPRSGRRHMVPRPPMTYQISATVACDTALAVSPGSSWKWAKLPRPAIRHSGRTSDPSGARTAGA